MKKTTLESRLRNGFYTGLTVASFGAATLFYGCDRILGGGPGQEDPKNPEKPVAEFVAQPMEGYTPLEVSFDASESYDSDGSVEKYIWDFGDGRKDSVSGPLVKYTYQSPGEYEPSLIVADNSGMRSEKKTLEAKISVDELLGQIAFVGERENYRSHIFAGDIVSDGLTNIRKLTDYDVSSVSGLPDDFFPDWSPDGKKIVFTTHRDGDPSLYTMDADGSNQTRLTKKGYANWPDWSPDGDKILYSYINQADSVGGIAFMSLDDGEITRLIEVPCFGTCSIPNGASWSPDGQQIIYHTKRDGNWEIYKMNSDGANQINVTNHPAIDQVPSWSPGKSIVFSSDREGDFDLYKMNSDGTGLERLTDSPKLDLYPDWSPDGKKIVFSANREGSGHTSLYMISSDGTNRVQLTSGERNFTPKWRPEDQ